MRTETGSEAHATEESATTKEEGGTKCETTMSQMAGQ